jgi:protein-disulfide isomerase
VPRFAGHLILIAALAPMLAACSGNDQPTLASIGSPGAAAGVSTDAAGSGGAFSDASTGSKPSSDAFNPLANPTDSAPGGREVIQNATVADVMMPGPLPEMSLGRLDAPVTIVQYASLTCPHCRTFHADTFPEFKRSYIDTGKVRYILREFPIGKQSGNATVALRCAAPEKYFDLYGKFMAQQASWVSQEVRIDPIFAVAKQVGMTRPQLDACLQNQAMIDGLKWVKERGRKLGVIGTPNFFIQGKLVKSTLTMKDIRDRVEPYLGASATASAASPPQR